MYKAFFGLKENPFNLTPDPRYLYLSSQHKEALNHLLYGINERKGFITITGGIGTGKTTLCRALLGQLDSRTKTALIFNAFVSDMELLRGIHREFGLPEVIKQETRQRYIDALNQFLLDNFSRGENAVLLIDEAQNLSPEVLEQIRMLSNLETEREKLIQIVLVGQSELKQLLSSPHLRQLNERITVRYDLKPLDSGDVRGYIEHRLIVAGGRGSPKFTRGAIKTLFRYSGGNPRRINAVCDRALLVAYIREKSTIARDMVSKAIKDIRGDIRAERRLIPDTPVRLASVIILILVLVMVAGYGGFSLQDKTLVALNRESGPKPSAVDIKAEPIVRKPIEVQRQPSLFLDEAKSLAGLFALYEQVGKDEEISPQDQLSLFFLNLDPEYYLVLKRPFRVRVPAEAEANGGQYLLIRRITDEGAVVLDEEGKDRSITKAFLLAHWQREVSWVYRPKSKKVYLYQGLEGPEIIPVQRMFKQIGYRVEPNALFDEKMEQEVVQFQKDFNLRSDGIVGPQTWALLYQMTGEDEYD